MKLTKEQQEAIEYEGNIIIEAVAGSGKTTTLVEFARLRQDRPILYLAFNRTVKEHAISKFRENNLLNVQVETAHSLAYKHMQRIDPFELIHEYKLPDLMQLLGIPRITHNASGFVIASHVSAFLSRFCNSDKVRLHDIQDEYINSITESSAAEVLSKNWDSIYGLTYKWMERMFKNEIARTHDFYLKMYQYQNPDLAKKYQYILFDEGQDASPVMLKIFNSQNCRKIIVGDRHQQIYGWRGAENALDYLDFDTIPLTKSFRFGEEIAQVASKVIEIKKKYLGGKWKFKISGVGGVSKISTRAFLARTNVGLLNAAIKQLEEKRKKFYFEGGVSSYTFSNGSSIYDALYLFLNAQPKIKNELFKSFSSFEQLEEFAEQTLDSELRLTCKMVKQYQAELFDLLAEIKKRAIDDRNKADYIFSTVHKAKGMEYDSVDLADDFISEARIEQILKEEKSPKIFNMIREELNILYVAVTRTKSDLSTPDDIYNMVVNT